MGRVVKVSSSPQPFKRVPIKPAAQQQQPGEVLIGYELEVADGCQLSAMGWIAFAALVCTLPPLSWLPFVCVSCKRKQQRPVYGYPMQSISFIAPDAVHTVAAKPAMEGSAAPTILCIDSSLQQQRAVQDQQQQRQQQLEYPASPRPLVPYSASPPPMSIFVPPSAVPACGFTADNPFPSRYSPVPASPKAVAVLGMQSPLRPASPAASGFAVMGGQTLGGANC